MQEESFDLKSEFIDLLQLLKATGYAATGGEAKMMVADGFIAVNGEVSHANDASSGRVMQWR